MYPLGSCTMKYNPKFTESAARFPGFANLHPLLPQLRQGELLTQGALEVLFEMEKLLCEMTGMDHFTMQPLAGAHGELTVRSIGAMLAPLQFDLPGGKRISPLYVAPWAQESGSSALSGLMRQLRGEWPCVPFGPAHPPEGLPSGWILRATDSEWDHGYAANHAWTLVDRSDSSLSLRIELPAQEPIAWMERRIRVDSDGPTVSVELTMQPRRDAALPFALHPTFSVPPDGVQLVPGPFAAVHTYPRLPAPEVSRLTPNCSAASLEALPSGAGTIDLSRLPLTFATEELLQLED